MDNLQHIDDLLRQASQVPANALVNDADWVAVEKKLKRRKNRIYAMWFFLALVSVSTVGLFLYENNPETNQPSTIVQTEKHLPKEDIKDIPTQPIVPKKNAKADQNSLNHNTVIDNKNSSTETVNSIKNNTNLSSQEANTSSTKRVKLLVTEPTSRQNQTKAPILLAKRQPRFAVTQTYSSKPPILLPSKLSSNTVANDTGSSKGNASPEKGKHWEMGISFTPSLSNKFTSINADLGGLINRRYNETVRNSESTAFANTYGFNTQYHGKKWFVATGLFMTQRREQLNYDYQITEYITLNTDKSAIDDYTPLMPSAYISVQHSGSNSYHFIEIPLSIGYKTSLSPNFEIRSQLGISYLSLIDVEGKKGNFTSLELEDLRDLKFNQHNIAANIKTGLYWNKKRFVLGVEPLMGLNLNSLRSVETSAIKTKPYSYGLNITSAIKLFKL